MRGTQLRPSATRSEIYAYTTESLATLKAHIQRERATASAITKPQPRTSLVASINRSAFRNRNPGTKAATALVRDKLEPTADGPNTIAISMRSPPSAGIVYAVPLMWIKTEVAVVLDDRIHIHVDEFAERIREHYDLNDLGDPLSSASDDITVVGPMMQDDDAAEDLAKLADGGIVLESSRSMENGVCVSLRFDANLKIRGGAQGNGCGIFFPGAIAALRGKNGGGGCFEVSEILTDLLWKKINDAKPDVVILYAADTLLHALHHPLHESRELAIIVPSVPDGPDLISGHAVFTLPTDVRARGDPRICLVTNPAGFTLRPFANGKNRF
ncbi:hypothetical protein B0H11DRAFT_1914970 [Mycena galericulata]|nr:hypothetical protein B0H11DRAFT_1914970 [Mycena galericulata]